MVAMVYIVVSLYPRAFNDFRLNYQVFKLMFLIVSSVAHLTTKSNVVTCHVFIQNTIDELVILEHKD